MAELSPDSGTILISTQVDVADQGIVSAQGFIGGVTWTWSIEGVPPAPLDPGGAFSVLEGGLSLTVDYIVTLGLFPFIVRYIDAFAQAFEVDDWALVPPPSSGAEVVGLRVENPVELFKFQLSVTATGQDSQTGDQTQVGAVYDLDIFQNYDINRDILVDEVNARS